MANWIKNRTLLASACLLLGWGSTSPGWSQEVESPGSAIPRGELTTEKHFALPRVVGGDSKAQGIAPLASHSKYFTVAGGEFKQNTVLLSEDFEASFPSGPWTVFAQGSADVTWGKSTHRSSSGTAGAWAAQSGSDFPGAGQDVPANTESWMVAGPFDLSSTSSGNIAFDLWLTTEQGFDTFFVGASLNGTNYTALGRDTDTSGWQPFSQDLTSWGSLGDVTGNAQVWFAFIYVTDGSITHEGAYVDDVALTVDTSGGPGDLNLLINQIDADNCPSVRAIVSVTDDQGNPVEGLLEQNFIFEEDGIERTFTAETAGDSGDTIAVTLVLDGSGSLSDNDVNNVKTASNAFIDLLEASDSVAVYHFGSNVALIQDFTTNKQAARAAVNSLTNNLGATSLFDAIVDAANHSTTASGRQALIVMTDGQDNDSSNSQQQAIDAARAAGIPVFTIGFGFADEFVLQAIASQTGGLFFQGATSADLQAILGRIDQTLNNQYILTWNTAVRDGQVHDVTVQVQFQGQTDTATTSYSQAGTACANAVPCVAGPNTLCLNRDRFRVEIEWLDFVGDTGPGTVAPCGVDDSGLFWFFSPNNWEMLIKVLDGCSLNNNYWVFFAATTNVGYTLTVTDTQTGVQKIYTNPLGFAPPAETDTAAFATCP